ncbi:diguanylate cyclase (GGDEF)-like protein [Deinococcus sp. UYEF24]
MHNQPFALLVADIDDLKIINDLYGHPVGDDAIAALAHAMQVATGGQVFSFGGDELALIVPGARPEVLGLQLQVLTQAWRERPLLSAPALYVAASIGGCLFPHEDRDVRSLYARADERMYAAKRACGAQVNLNDSSGEPQGTFHGREQSRLLERQRLLVALKGLLTLGGRAEIIGDPGSGRSAFAGQMERLARLAGLSVLRLSFGSAQRLREE